MSAQPRHCTRCGKPAAERDTFCVGCGAKLTYWQTQPDLPPVQPGAPLAAPSTPYVTPPPGSPPSAYNQPPPVYTHYPHHAQYQPPPQDAPLSGLIPYKNPKALVAYYCAVFSIALPVLAIPAIIFGVQGYNSYRNEPRLKGVAHAWVGIILGSAVILFWIGLIIVLLQPPA